MAGIEPKYSSQSLGEVHETLKILHKNSNGLMDHPTGRKNRLKKVTSLSIKKDFRKKKKKTYCHDNDKKYFRNNIICGSFYQRYRLILPSPSKLRHDFPHVISIKKVARLPYPSLSCKVSINL